VPRICFVNKMDRLGAGFGRTVDMVRHRLQANPIPIQYPIGAEENFAGVVDLIEERAWFFDRTGAPGAFHEAPIPADLEHEVANVRDEMIERIAECDDALLERYLHGEAITPQELKAGLRRATVTNQAVPVVCGAALQSLGIQLMLDAVVAYLPAPLDVPPVSGVVPSTGEPAERRADIAEPFSALAFKVVSDPYVGRLVYFRVYSGKMKAGSSVYNSTKGVRERLGRIVLMHANHREEVEEIGAGEIAAAVGLKNTFTGETVTEERSPVVLEAIRFAEPVISVAIEPKSRAEQDKLTDALIKLAEEDPTFQVRYDDETGQTVISGMGELHLEILVDRMKREFAVDAAVGRPQVAYREAITKPARAEGRFVRQTGGRGQFGHCVLEVEPGEPGAGYVFENKIVGGAIPREFIPAVQKGAQEALQTGIVGGYPVIDVKVDLVDGSFHAVDSSEIAFKIAASMAIKDALRRAGPQLLEPVMGVQVVTPGQYLGDVLADISSRRGKVKSMEGEGDTQVLEAETPLVEMFGYATDLRSATQGRATYTMEFSRYEKAPESILAPVGRSA
jgi:elongation factor G